eukprot:Amastigsp_a175013_31.p3 type:complete len:190 gc:universal Amastigsp_a175013_31:1-570(+)
MGRARSRQRRAFPRKPPDGAVRSVHCLGEARAAGRVCRDSNRGALRCDGLHRTLPDRVLRKHLLRVLVQRAQEQAARLLCFLPCPPAAALGRRGLPWRRLALPRRSRCRASAGVYCDGAAATTLLLRWRQHLRRARPRALSDGLRHRGARRRRDREEPCGVPAPCRASGLRRRNVRVVCDCPDSARCPR